MDNARIWFVSIVILIALSFWRDSSHLFQSPYPYGIDQYYYVAILRAPDQLEEIQRTAPVLPLAILRGLNALMPEAAAVKTLGLLSLYAAGAIAGITAYLGWRSAPAAGLAAFLVIRGFVRAELLVNFLKQSMGQALWLLLVLFMFLAMKQTRGRRFWIAACGVAGIAIWLTHSLTLFLAVAFGLLLLAALISSKWPRTPMTFTALALLSLGGWCALLVANAMPIVLGHGQLLVQRAIRPWPPSPLTFLYDFVSPIAAWTPLAFFETALLCLAIGVLLCQAWRMQHFEPPAESTEAENPAFYLAYASVPLAVFILSPFWIGAGSQPLGLHLRLVAALGPVAALLIPAGIESSRLSGDNKRRLTIFLVALLALPPAAWPSSTRPPEDGGVLHEAMVAVAPQVPDGVIVITSLRMGNSVNALWGNPRVLAGSDNADLSDPAYYRFTVLPPEIAKALEGFWDTKPGFPIPVQVEGPWFLIRQDAYATFRRHLRETNPELFDRFDQE